MLAEGVEDLVGEGGDQGRVGQVVEGFFEAESVEEPEAVDEGFVARGEVEAVE